MKSSRTTIERVRDFCACIVFFNTKILLVLIFYSIGLANAESAGTEFQVSVATNEEKGASVGVASDGSFVIAWEDKIVFDILARRYDATGNPLGAAFQVNTSVNEQKKPSVGVAPDGSFVIAWEDKTAAAVLARRYNAAGNPLGAVFQVNMTAIDLKGPSLGIASDGSFVIAWEDKVALDVLARRYDASGNPVGTAFQVNTSANDQKKPSIGVAPDGSFVITWEDKTALDILARHYDASGNPLGAVFQVNTSINDQSKPSIAVAADGSFVVVWEDKTAFDVLARRYDAFGNASGAVFPVNVSVNEQKSPTVGIDSAGSFVIAWEDKTALEILARQYDASGNPVSSDFIVNTTTPGDQKKPNIFMNGQGKYVVVWEDKNTLDVFGLASSIDLLAHWKLDEISGTTAIDSSGFGHDGTFGNGPTLGNQGNRGFAVDFDGVNNHVDLGNLDVTGAAITIAAWIQADSFLGTDSRIVAKADGVGIANNYWSLTTADSGGSQYLGILLKTDASGTQNFPSTTNPLEIGSWIHVAAVYNGSTVKLYKDGVEILSTAVSGDITNGPTIPVWIGGSPSNEKYFDGRIDDVRIYGRALTFAEIQELYSGFVGHWKLDETSGTTATDSTGSGFDGTYTNGPTLGDTGAYPGDVLTAVDFDGTDDHVDLPDMDIDYSNGLTAAFWVKPSQAPGTGQYYTFMDLANGQAVDEIWLGWINNVGFQLYMTDNADGSTLKTIEDNTNLEVGKWVHLVATVDAAGNATLYRNGKVSKSGFYTSIPTNVLRTQTFIAMSPWDDEFPGTMDDVRLYNRPLSATEVSELYGLTGHWKMDEGAGSTAADNTGFANNATLNGATWTTDCTGKTALEFDGTNDTAATNSSFTPPDTGTVTFWMRGADTPNARGRVFGINGNWEARQETDGSISFDLGASPFIGNEPFATPIVDDIFRWYHIVAMFDASDDSYSVYVNGVLEASGISPVDLVTQTAGILTFGTRTGSTEYWLGAMRDFRVYNRWLSGSEISDLSGLVAYWKLDESSGTVAVDSSPNGNDGTFATGSPTWTTAGNINSALDFEASDGADRVDAGTFDISGNTISISAWIRPEDGGHDQRIVVKSSDNGSGQYWGLTAAESNEPDFRLKAGGSWDRVLYTGIISPGKWYFLAGTYDGTTMLLYVNGVEVASKVHSVGGVIDEGSSAPVTLGDSPIGGRAFDGRIDDVRVFNRVLCSEEVFGQYKGGRPAGVRILKWVEVR